MEYILRLFQIFQGSLPLLGIFDTFWYSLELLRFFKILKDSCWLIISSRTMLSLHSNLVMSCSIFLHFSNSIQRDPFIWKTPFFSEMTHFFSNPMYPTYNTATKLQQLFTDLEAGVCRILVIIGETLVDPGTGQIRQKVCSTLTTSISQQLLLQVTALAAWVLPVKRAAVQNNQ